MNSIQNKGGNTPYSDDLDHIRDVYQQLDADEPPDLLDQAILNSAHRAVEKKPHWMKFGWLHGLTTTAVFILAFSIILNQRESETLNQEMMNGFETRGNVTNDLSVERRAKISNLNELSLELKEETRQQVAPAKSLRTMQAQQSRPSPSLADESDIVVNEILPEKRASDETTPGENISVTARRNQTPQTAAMEQAVDDTTLKTTAGQQVEQTAEQQLLAIIKLKHDGDSNWIKALELFKTTYPDYPLPSELKN